MRCRAAGEERRAAGNGAGGHRMARRLQVEKSRPKQWSEGRISNIDVSGKGFTYVFVVISVSCNPTRISRNRPRDKYRQNVPSKSAVFVNVINALCDDIPRWFRFNDASSNAEIVNYRKLELFCIPKLYKSKKQTFLSMMTTTKEFWWKIDDRYYYRKRESRFAKSCHELKVARISVERIEGRKREGRDGSLKERPWPKCD